ncbi:MAG: tetratricopeptide repeat protein [Thiobacillus sp.]
MIRAEKIVLTVLAALLPLPAALAVWAPSPAEMAALPPYCAARFNEGSPAFRSWRTSMGSDFVHLHHYCAGINFINRARASVSAARKDMLVAAVREFDYVLDHVSSGFHLRSEILMNRGVALSLLKRDGEAIGNLLEAIKLDPRQPRAYSALADLYGKQNPGKALEAVSEGLRHNPDAKALQRRYTELGGKLPYPAAIVAPAPVAPSEEAAGAAAEKAAPAADSAAAIAPAAAPAPAPAQDAPAPAKIGSPTNPYCRFCPD